MEQDKTNVDNRMQDTLVNRLSKIEGACVFKLNENNDIVPVKKSCFILTGRRDDKGTLNVQALGSEDCYNKINQSITSRPFPLE